MKRTLLLLTLVAALAACETTVEVDLPDHTPRLVVNSLFAADSLWQVRVTQSKSIRTTNVGFEQVEGATVELLQDGRVLDRLALTDDSAGPPRYTSEALRPQAGQTYTLRVAAPGFEPVEATSRVPEAAAFRLAARRLEDTPSDELAEITLTLDDPAQTKNYYALAVYLSLRRPFRDPETGRVDTIRVLEQSYFRASDPVLRENVGFGETVEDTEVSYREALFSDAAIDGQTHRLNLRPELFFRFKEDDEVRYVVALTALSPDAYDYLRSEALADGSNDNPFAEPVEVHSNVRGGLGIFAGTNLTERAAALPEQ